MRSVWPARMTPMRYWACSADWMLSRRSCSWNRVSGIKNRAGCGPGYGQGRAGSFDFVAEDEGDDGLVGWLSVEVLPFRRARQTGYLVIGVDATVAGRGIGRDLLVAAEQEAAGRGLSRLELTVMTDNLRALALYLRSGFQVEGLRRHALARDATVIDEYYMGKLLPEHDSR